VLIGCGWIVLLFVMVGCGPGKGTVSGTVRYNKQVVPGGTVTFAPVKGGSGPVSAPIDENGHYEITVPMGEMWIGVDNEALRPLERSGEKPVVPGFGGKVKIPPPEKGRAQQPAAGQQKQVGKYLRIPSRYARPGPDNGLKLAVTGGSQPHDIELK
jgi:hypothetical protein